LKKIESGEPLENSPIEHVSLGIKNSFVGPLVKEYEGIFQPITPYLPPEREITHTIPFEEGHKPLFRPIYRLSLLDIEEAKRLIAKYIHKGWIEPSSLPYGSLILFVKKERWWIKNGDRF
jgi:hypothetical protein